MSLAKRQRGVESRRFDERVTDFAHDGKGGIPGAIRSIFGDDLGIDTIAPNLDLRRGLDHASTGIPYSIHGTATIINQRVAYALATYQDPIKAVLGMAMHKEQKIVIRRKFVVGGHAMITPEHAQARTVAIREEEIEYVMARYGSDIFMNLNLFLKPEDAREELDMKLDAQIAALQQEQCRLAWDMVMKQGTSMRTQLARCSVANTNLNPADRAAKANDTYVHTVFGAMGKFEHPLQNLLAAAQQANAFDGVNYDTLLAPAGMLPLEMYTPEHSVKYAVTGVPTKDKKPINVGVENITRDPRTGLRIGVVQPFPDSSTAQSPYATAHGGGLTREVEVGAYYMLPGKEAGATSTTYRIPNMETRGWDVYTVEPGDVKVAMRIHKCVMSSAILAKSGSETGEMLFAWPHTGISTSQTTETRKMQLRAYFGAVLYKRENIMILEDVHCERVLSAHVKNDDTDALVANDAVVVQNYNGGVLVQNTRLNPTAAAMVNGPLRRNLLHTVEEADARAAAAAAAGGGVVGPAIVAGTQKLPDDPTSKVAHTLYNTPFAWTGARDLDVLYPGRIEMLTTESGWVVYQENQGHLGRLENPANPAAYGQFVYNNMRT